MLSLALILARNESIELGDKSIARAFCFHALRKSHASYLEAAGGDATESLGHSNRRLTQTVYLDASICGDKQWADLLPDVA